MNREYLIEIAMDTYADASGQSVSRPWMEAAFDAIAPRIWEEGWTSRHSDGELYVVTPNPYRIENA